MTEKSDIPGPFSPEGLERLLAGDPVDPSPVYLPCQLTYAAVVDVRIGEMEITDLMIRDACQEAEGLQVFPFAPRNNSR